VRTRDRGDDETDAVAARIEATAIRTGRTLVPPPLARDLLRRIEGIPQHDSAPSALAGTILSKLSVFVKPLCFYVCP